MSYTVNLIFGADQEKIIDYLLRDEKIIDFIIDINKVPVKEVIRYTCLGIFRRQAPKMQ